MSELLITTPPSWDAVKPPADQTGSSGRTSASAVGGAGSARRDRGVTERDSGSFPALLLGFQPPPPVTGSAAAGLPAGVAGAEADGGGLPGLIPTDTGWHDLAPVPTTVAAGPAEADGVLPDGITLPATGNPLPPPAAGGPPDPAAADAAGNTAAGLLPLSGSAPDDAGTPPAPVDGGHAGRLQTAESRHGIHAAGRTSSADAAAVSLADLDFVHSAGHAPTRSTPGASGGDGGLLPVEMTGGDGDGPVAGAEPVKAADPGSPTRDLFTALWRSAAAGREADGGASAGFGSAGFGSAGSGIANFADSGEPAPFDTSAETLAREGSGLFRGNPFAMTGLSLTGAGRLPGSFTLAPLGDTARWSDGLGDRMLMLAGEGSHSARLKLYPEHLGALDVRLRVEDGNAQLWFSSQHAQVRDALESSLPRLREMFAEQGLTLVHTEVNSGNPGERDAPDGRDGGSGGFGTAGPARQPSAPLLAAIRAPALAADRLIDLWA